MGRYLKNRELATASYSVRLPVGGGVLAPNSPVDGLIRYNDELGDVEAYSNGEWRQLVSQMGGIRGVEKDTFVGDGFNRTFGPMKYSYQTGQELKILVFIGNVFQNPGVAYVIDGDQIQFTSVPPFEQTIIILHGISR